MLISGTIQAVTPPDYTNQYGVQYQNITINTRDGPITGRIGCKKPYTTNQNLNQQGQWDMIQGFDPQGQPENKLKKHYDRPYQGQQGGAPQPPQGGSQGTQAPDNRGMYIIRQAVLKAVLPAAAIPLDMVGNYLTSSIQFVFTGKWELKPRTIPGPTTPNPAMGSGDYGPPEENRNTNQGDDIPF